MGRLSHQRTNGSTPSCSIRAGQDLVGVAARRPLGRVVDAGAGADQDQARDQLRLGQGQVQGKPGAHRVAQVVGPAARGADQAGAVPQARRHLTGAAVARRVQGDHGVGLAQLLPERPHAAPVWVKPWIRTTGLPFPHRSACST